MVAQAVATIALILLVASGITKLADPTPTTGAMSAARIPASNAATYLLAVTEVVVGGAALALGSPYSLVGGVIFLGFGGFVALAISKKLPVQSCGCFGREDTPPSRAHLVFNLVAAGSLIWLNLSAVNPIEWDMPVMALILFVGFAATGAYASYLLLSVLPRVHARPTQ